MSFSITIVQASNSIKNRKKRRSFLFTLIRWEQKNPPFFLQPSHLSLTLKSVSRLARSICGGAGAIQHVIFLTDTDVLRKKRNQCASIQLRHSIACYCDTEKLYHNNSSRPRKLSFLLHLSKCLLHLMEKHFEKKKVAITMPFYQNGF